MPATMPAAAGVAGRENKSTGSIYSCPYCQSKQRTIGFLRYHLRVKHGIEVPEEAFFPAPRDDTAIICRYCQRPQRSIGWLKWHIKRYHLPALPLDSPASAPALPNRHLIDAWCPEKNQFGALFTTGQEPGEVREFWCRLCRRNHRLHVYKVIY